MMIDGDRPGIVRRTFQRQEYGKKVWGIGYAIKDIGVTTIELTIGD